MHHAFVIALVVLWMLHTNASSLDRIPPVLPRQFGADLSVVSHLTDPRQSYPPSVREMTVQYDFDQKIARADVIKGYEAGKTYIRRYDLKKEYMVKHGQYQKCERAYLGETMPIPVIPFDQQFMGIESVRGQTCEHWVHSYSTARVHVFVDERTRVPIRLTEENHVNDVSTMMLTYDFTNIVVGAQNLSSFDLSTLGFFHEDCTRNVGGFPYVHAFHYYLRF